MNHEIRDLQQNLIDTIVRCERKEDYLTFAILYLASFVSTDRYEMWDIIMRVNPIYFRNNNAFHSKDMLLMQDIRKFSNDYLEPEISTEVLSLCTEIATAIKIQEKNVFVREEIANTIKNLIKFSQVDENRINDTLQCMAVNLNPEKYTDE